MGAFYSMPCVTAQKHLLHVFLQFVFWRLDYFSLFFTFRVKTGRIFFIFPQLTGKKGAKGAFVLPVNL
jgi:hypothetical protein